MIERIERTEKTSELGDKRGSGLKNLPEPEIEVPEETQELKQHLKSKAIKESESKEEEQEHLIHSLEK